MVVTREKVSHPVLDWRTTSSVHRKGIKKTVCTTTHCVICLVSVVVFTEDWLLQFCFSYPYMSQLELLDRSQFHSSMQWRIQGSGPAPPPPPRPLIFWPKPPKHHKTPKLWKGKNKMFETGPPPYLQVWIRHWYIYLDAPLQMNCLSNNP